MIRVILIVMLMNTATGEVSNVQQPRGFATEAECRDAAKLLTSTTEGWEARAFCLVPGEMEPRR